MSDPTDAVEEVRHQVETTDSVAIDTLVHDTVREYANEWQLETCMRLIEESDRVTVRDIGEAHLMGSVEPAGGETLLEKEIRYNAASTVVEGALDDADADTVTETMGI